MSGDITQTSQVNAIVALANSNRTFFTDIDKAIQRKCDNYYHSRLMIQMSKTNRQPYDGQVFIVKGRTANNFSFKDIIFIIDDLTLPMRTLVFNALCAAQEAGYEKIAMPPMRTGDMLGIVEKTVLDVVLAMKQGLLYFKQKYPDSVLTVNIIVHSDTGLEKFIKDNIAT